MFRKILCYMGMHWYKETSRGTTFSLNNCRFCGRNKLIKL